MTEGIERGRDEDRHGLDLSSDIHFYRDLPVFHDFEEVGNPFIYHPAPSDWYVVVADIKGSTKEFQAGRYKQVNMIGAACITAVNNAILAQTGERFLIPYTFGGDGATFLIPGNLLSGVRDALLGTMKIAERDFGFHLRAGAIEIKKLRELGDEVRVAKLQLSEGNDLAMFSGGGLGSAERLIKGDTDGKLGYQYLPDPGIEEPDLEGLSCRWKPLKSEKGVVLSLMIRAIGDNVEENRAIYQTVLGEIRTALGQSIKGASPVSDQTMQFSWIPDGLYMEAKLTKGKQTYRKRLFRLLYQSFIQFILEKFDLEAGGYNAPVYREELKQNSDFRRFDDVLRLVLDCTNEQAEAVEANLTRLSDDGQIAFGSSKSDHALMTCLVFDLDQSQHLHFVDGGEGGLTKASISYKEQLQD